MAEKRCVLITGASRGLGYELNRLYLERGWTSFPLVRDSAVADVLRQLFPGRCHPIIADLAFDDATAQITEAIYNCTKRLDLLINNAGIRGKSYTVDEVSPREVLDLLQVHCLGTIRCTKAVLPLLRAAEGAKIVNITSRLGSMAWNAAGEFAGQGFSYSYRIAKAAQNMFTLCLGHELIKEGIVVYGAHPDRLLTALAADDAGTQPTIAAARLIAWIERADADLVGHCIDLENGEIPW
ncbi:MAG: SDR family NAD(P)-dependent oxidoreductase [Acidiferrobacterales bacterium]